MAERIEVYQEKLRKSIHKGVTVTLGDRGIIEVRVPCTECDDPPVWTERKMLPPDAIPGKLRKQGWVINRHPKCPKHQAAGKAPVSANENNNQPDATLAPVVAPVAHAAPATTPTTVANIPEKKAVDMNAISKSSALRAPAAAAAIVAPVAPAAAPSATASDKARAAKREVVAWLNESFDVEAGRYKDGQSDATISKETGLSEAQVKELREDLYGPLKEPKELADLRADITTLAGQQEASNRTIEAMIAKQEEAADAIKATIDRLRNQQNDADKRFASDLDKLSGRLTRLLTTNNWG
jgi:hypothetical protein